MNLADRLVAAAGRLGGRTVLTLDDAGLSYRALEVTSARVAALLRRRGVRPGDRVAVMLPNVPEFAVVYYGVLRIGAVVVPLDPLLKRREVAAFAGHSGSRLLIAWHACAEVAEAGTAGTATECLFVVPGEFPRLLRGVPPEHDVAATADDDTAVVLYTAGTTERSELTHGDLGRTAAAFARRHGLGADDVLLGALPPHQAFGQTCALNATVHAGGRLTLMTRFDPGRVLELIRRDGVTVFPGVPAMYVALLDQPGASDLSLLRVRVSGGPALPPDVRRACETRFGGRIVEGPGPGRTVRKNRRHRGDD